MRTLQFLCVTLILVGCAGQSAEWNAAGNDALRIGDSETALQAYQSAQALAPDQPEPYLNAAVVYAALADDRRAEAAVQQVLASADPVMLAHTYYNLGNLYFQRGQFDLAVSAYREALLRTPDDADARYNLELALQQLTPPPPPPASATPTPEPSAGDQSPTPTPTTNPESDGAAPEGAQPMTGAEAQALLDSLDPNFQPLNLTPAPSADDPAGQDW
jgi:tetratricopeptide (TPR) repeat protein